MSWWQTQAQLTRDEVRGANPLNRINTFITDETGFPIEDVEEGEQDNYAVANWLRKRKGPRTRSQSRNKMARGSRTPITPNTHAGPMDTSGTVYRGKYHTALGKKPSVTCRRFENKETFLGDDSDPLYKIRDKTLNVHRLIQIPFDANDTTQNTRNSREAYVKGVLLRLMIRPTKTYAPFNKPITIRWCVIQPETNTGNISDISTTNFWRDEDTLDRIYKDFSSVADYNDLICGKINTEKYGVKKHGVLTISPSTGNYLMWDQIKFIKFWLPINKVVEWADNINDYPSANVYLCWWFCDRGDYNTAQQYDVSGTNIAPLTFQIHAVNYFKNVRS